MLIEALANLAEKTGAERISLEIPPSKDGSCAVMVVTSFGQSVTVNESEDHGKLLAALATPLVVQGHVGELDGRLVTLIDDLEDGFAEASKSLPETDAQKRKRELQDAAAKKDEKAEGKASAKKTVKKAMTKSDETDATAKDEPASHEDALASGEADSL
jgi:hypothetical protein